MGIKNFMRVSYAATNNKGSVFIRVFSAIVYDDKQSSFLSLHYQGEPIPLEKVQSASEDLMRLSFGYGEWTIFKLLSLDELLDKLWEQGVGLGLVYHNPKTITASDLGKWYYGTTLRYVNDGEPITLNALKIAFNEVLDGNAWTRGDSYMCVNGEPGLAGIVYGTDNEGDDAVRLATYINDLHGTDFGEPGFTGVDDIGCSGGTGSRSQFDMSILTHAVLSRTSPNSPWFITAALANERYAQIVRSFREEEGREAMVVRIGTKEAPSMPRGVDVPHYKLVVKLIPESIQGKEHLQEYMATQVSALIKAAKSKGLDVIPNPSDPIVGQRLFDSENPHAYMYRVLSTLSYETLVNLYEASLAVAMNELANKHAMEAVFASAKALIGLMSDDE